MSSGENVVQTGVDALLDLVKEKKKLSIQEAARLLKQPEEIVQNWIDFLVEEEILGIEYKFITPYVFLNENPVNRKTLTHQDTLEVKQEFFDKALQRGLPKSRIAVLWKKYVSENIESIKEEFYEKAKDHQIEEHKLEQIWERYKKHLIEEAST